MSHRFSSSSAFSHRIDILYYNICCMVLRMIFCGFKVHSFEKKKAFTVSIELSQVNSHAEMMMINLHLLLHYTTTSSSFVNGL